MSTQPSFGFVTTEADLADIPGPCSVQVTIPGEPVPQGRAKAGRWRSKDGREGIALRDPARSRNWKGVAQVHMMQAMQEAGIEKPLEGPIRVVITAWFSCPKSEYMKRGIRPARPHTKANGDYDNIGKIVGDAGNCVLWVDDRQIYDGRIVKMIGAQGDPPRVTVEVTAL